MISKTKRQILGLLRNRYGVRAQIFYGDKLAWTSTTAYPVITQNNPTEVEIQVEQV